MRPDVQYNNNKTTGDDNMPYLYVSAEIDGNEYRGRFKSKKKSKNLSGPGCKLCFV